MIKQKKNQELRSSLRILLGAIFLLAMAPASLRAKDAPVPSNGKITADASEAVSEEMTQEEAEALEKGLVEADKAGQLDRSLVEELSDGTEPEGTAKGIGWQYRKLAERSGESTLDIMVSRLDKIEGILDAIQAAQAAKDDTVGELAGMFVSALGAAVEKADTRQWFTLPAELRMVRAFVPPEIYNIRLLLRDGYGNIVGERVFENVRVQRGRRIFLHFRTAY